MKAFLITIDTEGDNSWAAPRTVTTENASFVARFQTLAEKHELKPTYLTNCEMATSELFQELGRRVLKDGTGEIGMHLHAWNSPPEFQLTPDDNRYKPYLIEYPEEVMREKIAFMTGRLEDVFEEKITSHRAGRWAFNETYARLLVELGYLVDCSVTPHLSWSRKRGDPTRSGGTSYYGFPHQPYFIDLNDIKRSDSSSSLLEVPLSVAWLGFVASFLQRRVPEGSEPHRLLRRATSNPVWLRPDGNNLSSMLRLLDKAVRSEWPCVEFMLHSSELMPGCSPIFPDDASIEKLYMDLDVLFRTARKNFRGSTLTEFYQAWRARRQASEDVPCIS